MPSLRFGITALELQEVSRNVIVNGIPDFSRLDVPTLVQDAISKDWSVIELSMDVKPIIPTSVTSETIERLIELKEETGVPYTVHLPYLSIELATFNEHVRKGCVESISEVIELSKLLNPEAYVLHATGDLAAEFSSLPYNSQIVHTINMLLAGFSTTSIEEIVSKTEINPRKLAIENYIFPFEVMREVIDDQDTSICFDTAHLLCQMSGTESIMDFYHAHKDRITEIHLQDGNFTKCGGVVDYDDHISLGTGLMSDAVLRKFLLELVKDKFDGPLIFELTEDEASESMNHIRKVVPEVLNYGT
jgi:sugar phosphate isomerase/epimerase